MAASNESFEHLLKNLLTVNQQSITKNALFSGGIECNEMP